MRPRAAQLAGLGAGALALGAVAVLLQRTLRPAQEIRRYADDIRVTGDAIAANLEGTGKLRRTAAVAGELAERAAGSRR